VEAVFGVSVGVSGAGRLDGPVSHRVGVLHGRPEVPICDQPLQGWQGFGVHLMKGMRAMDNTVSPELFAQLWDDYAHATKQYQLAKHVTDQAEAAHDSAYKACEVAHAEEVTAGRAVVRASEALQAASDAAFLAQHGISSELTCHLS
jgi:hypothetical protein